MVKKVNCEECGKKCRGEVLHLKQYGHYFHQNCFVCKECGVNLGAAGYYPKNGNYYCSADYDRLFGVKCAICDRYVQGDVLRALERNYHYDCFKCTECASQFLSGQKVSFVDGSYLCSTCFDRRAAASAARRSSTPKKSPSKSMTVAGVGPGGVGGGYPAHSSPYKISPSRPTYPSHTSAVTLSPTAPTTSATTPSEEETISPSVYSDSHRAPPPPAGRGWPQSQSSLPAGSSGIGKILVTPPGHASGGGPHDGDESTAFGSSWSTNLETASGYSIPSSVDSLTGGTRMKRDTGSLSSFEFGRFYRTSFLNKASSSEYLRKAGTGYSEPPPDKHFHCPENYTIWGRASFGKSGSYHKGSNDFAHVRASARASKRRSRTPPPAKHADEPIRLSLFPSGYEPPKDEQKKLDREDWPCPPSPAAVMPEIIRRRHASRESDTSDSSSVHRSSSGIFESGDDPRIVKDIEHMKKFAPESGMAKDILQHLEETRSSSPTLDPRSSSRTPAANREPQLATRYQSSMFASPSRLSDHQSASRPSKGRSLDDFSAGDKTRTAPPILHNYQVLRPGYTQQTSGVSGGGGGIPGAGPMTSRSATLPPESSGPGLLMVSSIQSSDQEQNGHYSSADESGGIGSNGKETNLICNGEMNGDSEDPDSSSHLSSRHHQQQQQPCEDSGRGSKRMTPAEIKRRNRYQRQQRYYYQMDGADSDDQFKIDYMGLTPVERGFSKSLSYLDKQSLTSLKSPPKIYSYKDLNVTNVSLPKDVDKSRLELHLSDAEFGAIFQMDRRSFQRLPTFRQTDLKKKHKLLYTAA